MLRTVMQPGTLVEMFATPSTNGKKYKYAYILNTHTHTHTLYKVHLVLVYVLARVCAVALGGVLMSMVN